MEFAGAIVLAAGLGLLGFVEPCSAGGHLLFVKYVDRAPAALRAFQTTLFTVTRAVFMASLGLLAALIGTAFAGLQHGLWALLGALYAALGVLYLAGGAPWLMGRLGRWLPGAHGTSGSVGLGLLFGLNIPVCAAPLLAVLLGDTAARAAAGGGVVFGMTTLFVFGVALSSPLVLAVYTRRGRHLLEAIARISTRMPSLTGMVLVALGGWSLYLAVV